MKTAVCLQHVPFEGPGLFRSLLQRQGYRVETCMVPADGLPQGPGDFLLVMGGPMSVNDPLSWIAEEIEFIRRAMDRRLPMLGVCLGAQLFARALGASIWPGPRFEVGFMPVILTEAGKQDPVFRMMPSPLTVFQWHGEGFDQPPNSAVLAASDAYPVQAFRHGAHVYGLLFHVELDVQGIEALCRECPDDVRRGQASAVAMRDEAGQRLSSVQPLAETLIAHLTHLPSSSCSSSGDEE